MEGTKISARRRLLDIVAVTMAATVVLIAAVALVDASRSPSRNDLASEVVPPVAARYVLCYEPLTVEAMAHDYSWRFSYPGPDSQIGTSDDVRQESTLHLPLDTDVRLLVRSQDYVCTFTVPELKLRRIAVPELTYALEFRTANEGAFEVIADSMCGLGLLGEKKLVQVLIQPRDAFEAWLAASERK